MPRISLNVHLCTIMNVQGPKKESLRSYFKKFSLKYSVQTVKMFILKSKLLRYEILTLPITFFELPIGLHYEQFRVKKLCFRPSFKKLSSRYSVQTLKMIILGPKLVRYEIYTMPITSFELSIGHHYDQFRIKRQCFRPWFE